MELRSIHNIKTNEDRIKLIADLIEEGSQSPIIRETAIRIVQSYGVKEKDKLGEVKAIFDWVKKNIRYIGDVRDRDSYHTAERILSLRAGDCDDFTILICSLLGSIGYECGLRIVSNSPFRDFHHIYALINVNGKWIPLDGTEKHLPFGKEPDYVKKRDYRIIFE